VDALPEALPPSPVPVLAVRVVVAVLIVLHLVATWMVPADRSVDDLLAALARGDVRSLTVAAPAGDAVGPSRSEWTTPGRPGTTPLDDDDRAEVLDAAAGSPGHVTVRVVDDLPARAPWLSPYLPLVALAAAFVLLVTQPGPHLATRWAWFWLGMYAWPFWLAYVLLEPTPVWSRRPVPVPVQRLTGGWAWLAGVLLGNAVVAAVTGA
jgi:hypothetical protein